MDTKRDSVKCIVNWSEAWLGISRKFTWQNFKYRKVLGLAERVLKITRTSSTYHNTEQMSRDVHLKWALNFTINENTLVGITLVRKSRLSQIHSLSLVHYTLDRIIQILCKWNHKVTSALTSKIEPTLWLNIMTSQSTNANQCL